MQHSGLLLSFITISVILLSVVSGYVLDHNRRTRVEIEGQTDRLRGREEWHPTTTGVPVKTNEEETEDGRFSWAMAETGRGGGENEFLTENSAESDSSNGERYWSNIFDRFLPSSFHGHMQLGPGLSFNVSTGAGFPGSQPWWNGPHVCVNVDRKEENDDDVTGSRGGRRIFHHRLMITHSCDETESVRKCTTVQSTNGRTTRITKTYECCPGFAREEDQPTCVEEVERVDLISTMEQLSATEMVQALALTGLTNRVQSSNYTIFAPTNQAFDKYQKPESNSNVVVINEEVQRLADGLNSVMTSHIVSGAVRTSAVEDEEQLQTQNPDAKIRINKYTVMGRQNELVTANCIPITRANVKSTNGMVHIVESVLQPVILDIKFLIRNDSRLSIMSSMLERIDLDANGQYTILAPTDEAFEKLSPGVREKILHGHTCGKDIIKQHILPNVICTAVIEGRVRTRNILNNYIHMSRDPESSDLFVEKSRVIERDIMATNGVIHVIDDVVLSSAAVDITEALERAGATKFLELLRATHLESELQNKENYTLFVPSNDALEEVGKLNLEGPQDENDVMKILSRHTVSGVIRGRQLYHGRKLNNTNQRDVLTVQSQQPFPLSGRVMKSVQCSPIIRTDVDTCDAVVHVVSKLIVGPTGNILDLLQKNSSFSELFELIRTAELTELLSGTHHALTLFAPTNQAFRTLPDGFLDELRRDSVKARKVLLSLILPDIHCCSGIFSTEIFSSHALNMDRWMISLEKRDRPTRVRYGSVPVTQCDLPATNGLVHAIESFPQAVLRRYSRVADRRGGGWGFRYNVDDFLSSIFS